MNHQSFLKFTDQQQKDKYYNIIAKIKTYLSPEGPDFDNLYSWMWSNQLNDLLYRYEKKNRNFKYMGI